MTSMNDISSLIMSDHSSKLGIHFFLSRDSLFNVHLRRLNV